jgi:8-oxo-dGTP pyrophosphatase MutT (NUDIX family)
MTTSVDDVRVTRTERIALRYDAAPFHFPAEMQPAIEAHWIERTREVPELFNGTVHITFDLRIDAGGLTGVCRPITFKEFLHWRDGGDKPKGFIDAFGSAIVRSCEGHILLGRASRHTINAGWAYFFGGFIDVRDQRPDETIDIDGSIIRELREETGLEARTMTRMPGYVLAEDGALLCVAIVLQSRETAAKLQASLLSHARAATEQEIEEIVVIQPTEDLAGRRIKPYAAAVIRSLLQT